MFVRSIRIGRVNDYGYGKVDPTTPFQATVAVEGQHGKVELTLSPDLSARIVAIIADEIAAAGRATAEVMTASILDSRALSAPAGEAA